MNIKSVQFERAVVGDEDLDELKELPQIAFIGRSNAGKSSLINLLAQKKGLARTSATAGLTKEINAYLINKTFYLMDMPGYGYARMSVQNRHILRGLIEWYLLNPDVEQKLIVVIVDAKVGLTDLDKEMLSQLSQTGKRVVIVANKTDKLKKNDYRKQMDKIKKEAAPYLVIPFSVEKKIGIPDLNREIFKP